MEAATLLTRKVLGHLPEVAAQCARGLLPLLGGALVLWLAAAREKPRALRAAAATILALAALSGLVAALSVPQLRYLFPTRVPLEAAGVLALFSLVSESGNLSPVARRALLSLAAVLVLSWGAWQTWRGQIEAREASQQRGTPSTLTLLRISSMMSREIPAGEPVMSNLGAILAWESRRPVIHLTVSPDDLAACRRHMDFKRVILVFRDADHAWPEWQEVVARPTESLHHTDWGVRHVRLFSSADGFQVVWLDLAPLGPELAER